MASYLFGTKPLSEPLLSDGQLGPQGQIPAKLWFKYKKFLKKISFQNVFEITAISFWLQCVKTNQPIRSSNNEKVKTDPGLLSY